MNVQGSLSWPLTGLILLALGTAFCHGSQADGRQPERATSPASTASPIRIEEHLLPTEDRTASHSRRFVASGRELTAEALRRGSPVRIGSVGDDPIYVTLDAIEDDGYLAFAAGGTNGVVITHFLYYEDLQYLEAHSDTADGTFTWRTRLGAAVLSKIRGFSPAQAERLGAILDAARMQPGTVLHFKLESQGAQRPVFTHCYILLFQVGDSADAKQQSIRLGLGTILSDARRRGVQHLIVPPLTIKYPEHPEEDIPYSAEELELESLYQTILDELQTAPATPAVYIGMYSGWPGTFLDHAIDELQRVIRVRDNEAP